MFMPPSSHEDDEFRGAGLTNLEYALLAEQMGHIGWASEVFNCSAPDTGNMEVLMRYGTKEHKKKWLRPLMDGEIRSAFLMTEPAVASSDATNIETSIKRDGDEYVINGRKWWSSGVGDPRCQILIVMGKTDPGAPRHQQQSQILGAARQQGHHGREDAAGVRASTTRRTATPRCCSKTFGFPPAIFCSARAGVLRSRRAGSVRAASIIACAPSARPRKRSRRW